MIKPSVVTGEIVGINTKDEIDKLKNDKPDANFIIVNNPVIHVKDEDELHPSIITPGNSKPKPEYKCDKKRVLNIIKANFEKICSICPKEKEDELMEASRVMHEASSGTVTAELDDEESIANYANHSIELGKSQTMPKVKFVVQLPGEVFLEKFLLVS